MSWPTSLSTPHSVYLKFWDLKLLLWWVGLNIFRLLSQVNSSFRRLLSVCMVLLLSWSLCLSLCQLLEVSMVSFLHLLVCFMLEPVRDKCQRYYPWFKSIRWHLRLLFSLWYHLFYYFGFLYFMVIFFLGPSLTWLSVLLGHFRIDQLRRLCHVGNKTHQIEYQFVTHTLLRFLSVLQFFVFLGFDGSIQSGTVPSRCSIIENTLGRWGLFRLIWFSRSCI